jgi:hypothetical protein
MRLSLIARHGHSLLLQFAAACLQMLALAAAAVPAECQQQQQQQQGSQLGWA